MSPGNIDVNRHVIIGQINGLYGVHGGMKVYSYTKPRNRIFSYRPWLIKSDRGWEETQIHSEQDTGKGLIVFLEGVTGRDEASKLIGVEIAVQRNQLPPLGEGNFYWCDLIHMEVVDVQGRCLGKVLDMQETGANDVMVVVLDEQRYLIAWVMDEIIKKVDLEAGRITVDWSPGYQ